MPLKHNLQKVDSTGLTKFRREWVISATATFGSCNQLGWAPASDHWHQ